MLQRILSSCALLSLVWTSAHAEDCRRLTRLKLAHVSIASAQAVPAGAQPRSPAGNALPAAPMAYCRIQGTSRPSPDSDIRFELWVPAGSAWNGKFEQVGNGGFAGAVPYRFMAHVMAQGYAVAGTDDGHQSSNPTDARWALNHPEKLEDFGWRAIDETARASKRLLRALRARAPAKSYFIGCSDGGREALIMARRFPTYFDGIIAGAPAFAMTRLLTGGAVRSAELKGSIEHLSAAELELLQSRALSSCGDGAAYLKDPRGCHVDLDALKCAAGATGGCLSDASIRTARVMYAERRDPASGGALYGVLPGAEAAMGSWDQWLTGSADQGKPTAGAAFTWNYLAYMVMKDPHLDSSRVTEADLVLGERRIGPVIDSDDVDLSAFKAHGGKLIHYHGWNDPGIPAGYSLEYHDRLVSKIGGANDFYRLYMVPGMLHCGGGNAPTLVNWQAALEAWVERSMPPGQLTATDGEGATQTLEPFN